MTEWREQLIARGSDTKVVYFIDIYREKRFVVEIIGPDFESSEWEFETREEARSLFDNVAKIIKAEPEIQIVEV